VPECDIFNRGSSYLNVTLTTVHHLYDVDGFWSRAAAKLHTITLYSWSKLRRDIGIFAGSLRFKLLLTCYTVAIVAISNTHTHTHTHTRLSALFPWLPRWAGTRNLDFTEARDSEWQWHQLVHMQTCTSLQTDNHASISHHPVLTGRMPFLPPNQQHQSIQGKTVIK